MCHICVILYLDLFSVMNLVLLELMDSLFALVVVLLRRKQSKSKPGTRSTRQPRHQLTPQI